jgi:capsular exopolysaccharide synthesis family protein
MSTSIESPILEESPRQGRDNFRSVVNVITERWILLVAGTLLGALSFGGGTLLTRDFTPPRYQASGSLYIKPAQFSLLSPQSPRSDFRLQAGEVVKQTSKMALAEKVAQALIQKDIATGGVFSNVATPEEFEEQARRIHERIEFVTSNEDGGKVEIVVKNCDSKAEAEDIAEYATRVFLDMNRQVHVVDAQEKHALVKQRITELRDKLAEAEAARLAFKQEHGFKAYENVDQDLAKKEQSLREVDATRQTIQQKLQELESELKLAEEQFPESLGQPSDNMVAGLFQELDALLEEKMSLSAVYQPTWPRLQELEEEIAEVRTVILEAERQRDSGVPGGSDIWSKRKEIYQQQIDLRLQLTSLEIRADAIERERAELVPQLPELANLKFNAESLKREVDSIEKQLNDASDLELEIRASIEHGLGSVERSVAAVIAGVPMPVKTGEQRGWVNFVIGGIAGFVLAFALAMMMEFNDTSIRSIEDVNEYIGVEVIGTIPRMRFGRPRGGRRRRATYVSTVDEEQIDSCIVTQHDPKSPISEAYRTLRTNFQFATIKEKPRTVMVTSAVPGEGKTTTAVNLAVTMADRGMRVLIVDTDLRRPNVHRVLRMERGPGLADVLREGLEPKSVIRPTRIENLWIISSGRVPPNPSELIGSDHMAQLMNQLGDEFDLVICDAPSVLVVTDPVLLATHVDTCMMVVSTNNARRETVVRAKKLLLTAQVSVAGVVVNGLETTRRHYYYYYYYYDDGSSGRRKWYHF